MSDKKYQVFVSSTFTDLQEERHMVMQELLALHCIPMGMDLYPSNNAQWNLIKSLIDDCDYYFILIGGRYGTLSPSGVSFTHREYTYAATKQKPVFVLAHSHPEYLADEKREATREGQLKLQDFKTILKKHTYVPWTDKASLTITLRKTFLPFIQKHPMQGWVRGNQVTDMKLVRENAELKKQLEELRASVPTRTPTRTLAEVGSQKIIIHYACKVYVKGDCKACTLSTPLSWSEIFSAMAPAMLDPASENGMMDELAHRLESYALEEARKQFPKAHAVRDIEVSRSAFNTIKVQLRAMGLIGKHTVPGPGGQSLWVLTALGDSQMNTLIAKA